MKISILSVGKAGSRFTNLVFISAIIGAGLAGAETYQHGGSTAIIQQSGGIGQSESQVKRYQDGQSIITRDGSSTDITIQREEGFPPSDNSGGYPGAGVDDFYQWFFEERFSSIDPDDQGGADASDDFKQRMLDRMRGDFPP